MALPGRPNIIIRGNEAVYQSLDAVDETFFNQLGTKTKKKGFLEMIRRWREEPSCMCDTKS